MIGKIPDRLFFILTALVILLLMLLRHPDFNTRLITQYRYQMFDEFNEKLVNNEFDAEEYWEFRERYSPGVFTRDEYNTDFLAHFRIINADKIFNPLFYYESKYIRSLDSLVSLPPAEMLANYKNEFPGEIVAEAENFVFIKQSDEEYVFAFVESIEKMQEVVGMFDYIPSERELIEGKYWYNATYIAYE